MKAHTILAHPHLVRAVRNTLAAGGIPDQDLDDAVADVQLRALERMQLEPSPRELAGWNTLCETLAVVYAADARRERELRGRFEVPLVGDVDDYADGEAEEAEHRVDHRRLAELLHTHLAEMSLPDVAFGILDGVANGMKRVDLSKEVGLSAVAVQGQLATLRRGFRARLKAQAPGYLASRVPRRPVRCRNGTRGK